MDKATILGKAKSLELVNSAAGREGTWIEIWSGRSSVDLEAELEGGRVDKLSPGLVSGTISTGSWSAQTSGLGVASTLPASFRDRARKIHTEEVTYT